VAELKYAPYRKWNRKEDSLSSFFIYCNTTRTHEHLRVMSSDMSEEEVLASDADNWEDWEDNEAGPMVSLFGPETFSTVDDVLQHDAKMHGFDLLAYRQQVGWVG
jgi:hypothetical protein